MAYLFIAKDCSSQVAYDLMHVAKMLPAKLRFGVMRPSAASMSRALKAAYAARSSLISDEG